MSKMDQGPKFNPGNNGEGVDPTEAKKAREIFQRDFDEEMKKKRREEDERQLAELSEHPFRVTIEDSKLKRLQSTGEVSFRYVDLRGRKLVPGEVITLEDVRGEKHDAIFVHITPNVTGRYGRRMTVRLPETRK